MTPKEQKLVFSDTENFKYDCKKAILEGYIIHQIIKDDYARHDAYHSIEKGYWLLLYKF